MRPFNLPPGTVIGIGSIEIHIVDPKEYQEACAFYQHLYSTKVLALKGGGYSIALDSTELRLLNPTVAHGAPNRTIIYWQMPSGDPGNLDTLYQKLLDTKQYQQVLAPACDDFESTNNYWETRRAVLADVKNNGNEFGLVINPPYPRKKRRFASRRLIALVLGSATSMLLGTLLASGARKRR